MNNGDNFDFGRRLGNGLNDVVDFLPELIGALALVILGWFIASLIRKVTLRLLHRIRFDRAVTTSPAGNMIHRIIEHPSSFVSKVAFWAVMVLFISFAISALNVPALNAMVVGFYGYIPNIIAAILIFLVASAISTGAAVFIRRIMGDTPLSKLLIAVVPGLTMAIAAFMILNQLKIAEDIVNITYTAIMGSLALGLALAFGLGGRDVASKILTDAYDKAQQNRGQISAEARRAASNARRQARNNT